MPTNINDILTLDLQEDIKNVIDLEDKSEQEIQKEIESYIVTEGIGKHLNKFTDDYTSNISETGVWLSGFYGSGKSYFGKMLGYIIDNPIINGTSARDRFIPRIKGVKNDSILETSIRNLDRINSRVIFLDVAKQNTDKGLAFTLFVNLLKNLGFRDDIYGYMEFDLFLDGKLDEFKELTLKSENKEWDDLKKNARQVARVMRRVYGKMGYNDAEYNDTKDIYSESIKSFSSSKLKGVLERYLAIKTDETLVFIFDEASEAISQKKFTLLDLEGLSESLSSMSGKVWTIAIAQEKLDDVINNANVDRKQLNKVTDRFKTKIHLESNEVDVIIRSRLLQKTDQAKNDLIAYYNKNDGLVSDITNLKSTFPTKTKDADEFATYYPFHRYQFDILQKFLFSSNALVATQIAARGMIITTFDVLRKQMKDQELYKFTTGHALCTEAQTAIPADLVNKYDTARKVLKNAGSPIHGKKLLKTIHLLADSEVVSPTVENITKSYITDITDYYDIKPEIEKALALLIQSKVLLLSNHNYKITSDLEGRLLEEMHDFDVKLFSKKRSLIKYIKDDKIFSSVSTYSEGDDTFKFNVLSDDQGDELSTSGDKHLNICVYSLFNISDDRQDFIAKIKLNTQNDKDTITLIPDNTHFEEINKLIGEISRYSYIEEKYANESDQAKRQIIRDFTTIREEKEKVLRDKITASYKHSSLIYLFDEHLLDENSFKGTTTDIQKKLVKNIYTKRLSTQLSDALAPKVFSTRKEALSRLFSGDDFKFFDTHGTFTGDHLKVVDEIKSKIKSGYTNGKTLEADLTSAPWGYSYGTLVTTIAVLLRAGRVSVKFNGDTYYSHEQKTVHDAFKNSTKFKSASFKAITAALSSAQKSDTVTLLRELEIEEHTDRKVDWNINDFDLADSIRLMAEHFIGAVVNLNDTVDQFEHLFPSVAKEKQNLQPFTGKVTEGNYIEKVQNLLNHKDEFSSAIEAIIKAQKFIKKNFSKVREFQRFITDVQSELKKAGRTSTAIQDAADEFTRLYRLDMVKHFGLLTQQAQIVKDSYYKLIKTATEGMSQKYNTLDAKVEATIRDLQKNYPPKPNELALNNLKDLQKYCKDRIVDAPSLDYSTTCKRCGYSLSDVLNYTALAPNKDTSLLILQSGFISVVAPSPDDTSADQEGETPPPNPTPPKKPRKITFSIQDPVMSVQEYKTLLTSQLTSLANANPNEEIELVVDSEQ